MTVEISQSKWIWLFSTLTHWGRVTHLCVSKLFTICSDNGLSPGRPQPINWTDDGILLIGPPGTNFNEILIEIYKFSFKKIHFKMSSGKWRPSCLDLNSWYHGWWGRGVQCVNLKLNLDIGIYWVCIQVNIALGWMPENLIDGKPKLVCVMACCRYLNQCGPWSSTAYAINRPQ